MKSVGVTALVILVLAVLTAWAGWWTFSANENESNIRIDTAEIRRDTAETMDEAGALTERAGQAVDDSVDVDIRSPQPQVSESDTTELEGARDESPAVGNDS